MSLFVVMGVSGCGKSSLAEELANLSDGTFLDADDFHPPANKAKMAAGIPLQDDDRWGWLDALNAELKTRKDFTQHTFLACSALRQIYRERLAATLPGLRFIYLQGSKECIGQRLSKRTDHFMPPALLESQFATLEEPVDALVIPIDQPLPEVVRAILAKI
jgi:gluconokinase